LAGPVAAASLTKALSAPAPPSARSTEATYAAPRDLEDVFVGPFRETRRGLDYSYHSNYRTERQAVQDGIVARFLQCGVSVGTPPAGMPAVAGGASDVAGAKNGGAYATAPALAEPDTIAAAKDINEAARPWIVYTAGAMGAGKSHSLRDLHARGLFPLERFIWIDPDAIKGLLPDTPRYVRHNRREAGALTHKESGFIAEIVTIEALRRNKCLVIDGSARDHEWYARCFERMKREFPHYCIAILMITAPRERVFARARRRAAVTFRVVSDETIDAAIEQVPVSFERLRQFADYAAVLENVDDARPPRFAPPATEEAFSRLWDSVRSAPAPGESALAERMIVADIAVDGGAGAAIAAAEGEAGAAPRSPAPASGRVRDVE